MAIWQDKMMAEISKWQGMIHISSIMSIEKNQGNAREFMKWLTDLADKHQVKMDLTVKPLKNAGGREGKNLTKTQLKAWYQRNGFKKITGDIMEREPKPITEAVVKPWAVEYVDVKKAVDLLNKHCSRGLQAISTGGLLFRGFKHDVAVMTIDASQGERTSRDTNNIYQLMMDISDSMKDFPSRSKSLICSSNIAEAASYGMPMVIVPFDGTKVVVSNVDDFIHNDIVTSWSDGIDVDLFSDEFEHLLEDIGLELGDGKQMTMASVSAINDFIDSNTDDFAERWCDAFEETPKKELMDILSKNKGRGLQALAAVMFHPDTLNLKMVEFGRKLPTNVECWFSGPCVAIDARLFAGVVHALRQGGHAVHRKVENAFVDFFHRWPSLNMGELTDDALEYIQSHMK
jgi:hypothetical protein